MRARVVPMVLLALSHAASCAEHVSPARGCDFDAECRERERCVEGRCTLPIIDGGGVDDDGGGGEHDAGTPCEPDALENGTPASAYAPGPSPDDGLFADGRFCADVDEYLRVSGFDGDPVHAVVVWEGVSDIDVHLLDPGQTAFGDAIGQSYNEHMEVATGVLGETGDSVLRLTMYGELPPGGLDYHAEVRSGLPCRDDDDCFGDAAHRCLMPLWTPETEAGEVPFGDVIFRGGLCAAPYQPCDPATADSPAAEGVSASRTDAISGMPTVSAWSCRFDEDWFSYDMPISGDLTLRFTNEATAAATFLLTAFDASGNMLGGVGWADLPLGAPRALVIPLLRAGTRVYVRVFQLHDDDFGLYRLSAETFAVTCVSATDCARDEARSYGRTECRTGSCECPLPDACSPPT